MKKQILLLTIILLLFTTYSQANTYKINPSFSGSYLSGAFAGIYNITEMFTYTTYEGFCLQNNTPAPESWETYTETSIANLGDNYQHAAWVYDNFENVNWQTSATAALSIWDIINENRNHEYYADLIGTGSYYDYMLGNSGRVDSGYTVLMNEDYQDFIIKNPVPLPGAVWLLGIGIISLLSWKRKFLT